MRKRAKIADPQRGLFGSIKLPVTVELAVEVRRPCHVNDPTVNVLCFSMSVIRFGMDVKQGNRQHPHGCPDQDSQAKPGKFFTLCLHYRS